MSLVDEFVEEQRAVTVSTFAESYVSGRLVRVANTIETRMVSQPPREPDLKFFPGGSEGEDKRVFWHSSTPIAREGDTIAVNTRPSEVYTIEGVQSYEDTIDGYTKYYAIRRKRA